MLQKICHTKKYAVMGFAVGALWTATASWPGLPGVYARYPGAEVPYNLSLLAAALVMLGCVVRMMRARPLLLANEKGLALRLPKNRGVLPWTLVEDVAFLPQWGHIRLYLQGAHRLQDLPGKFDVQVDGQGLPYLPLKLKYKVCSMDKTCDELAGWLDQYVANYEPPARDPDADPVSVKGRAAAEQGGLSVLLFLLSLILGKYWLLTGLLCLLCAALLEGYTALPRLWVLLLPALVLLPASLLLRRGLQALYARLLHKREDADARAAGL